MFGMQTKYSTNSSDSKDSSFEFLNSSDENLEHAREALFTSTSSLYHATKPFQVYFLGQIQDVNLGGKNQRDPDVQLIDKLEEGQLEGKIRMVAKEEDLVELTVSKYGVKVTNLENTEVSQRHPLHTVAQVVCYADSFYKSNVAFKVGQVGRTVFDCYVFQCGTETQAQAICESVKRVFELISSK